MEPNIKIKLSDHPWQACDCGGLVFEEKLMLKRISGLMTGQSEDQHAPIPVIICTTCDKVPSFVHAKLPVLPDEIKATPINKITM